MRSVVAFVAIVAVILPSGVSAGPILDSALRAATRVTPSGIRAVSQQPSCQQLAQQGEQDGRTRQGQGGWLAGGLLLSPFFVPIMPIVAHTTEPTPASDALADLERDDIGCYTTGYVRAAKGKRIRASWIGYGISMALWAVLVGVTLSDDDYRF